MKYSAPADDTPVPDSVNGSLVVNAPTSRVAPLATLVPEVLAPSAELLATLTVPAVTVVVPEYVLTPDSDNVPESAFVKFHEPEMIPEIGPVAPLAT